jgi:hypothetical protein
MLKASQYLCKVAVSLLFEGCQIGLTTLLEQVEEYGPLAHLVEDDGPVCSSTTDALLDQVGAEISVDQSLFSAADSIDKLVILDEVLARGSRELPCEKQTHFAHLPPSSGLALYPFPFDAPPA